VEAFPKNATQISAGKAHLWICKMCSHFQVYWSNTGTQIAEKTSVKKSFYTVNI